jgi:3-hydroxyisobutyrate dehydrogenase
MPGHERQSWQPEMSGRTQRVGRAGQVSRVGLVGLGRMGLPIGRRLVAAGFDVHAYDLRSEVGEAIVEAGARWAGSVAEAAGAAEVLVTVLPGPREVLAVVADVAGALGADAVWLELSTASPPVAEEIAARGVATVDAPVGGGPSAAGEGRLVAFAGGADSAVSRCLPVLAPLTERVIHTGPSGTGYATKLLVNALWFAQACATAEAMALGARLGLDPEDLLAVLNQSAAASRFLAADAPALVAGDDLPSFPLARCHEELASVLSLGQSHGVPLDVLSSVAELHAQAMQHYGDADGELLGARFVADRAGVSLSPRLRPGDH